jgi:hypothetical protein
MQTECAAFSIIVQLMSVSFYRKNYRINIVLKVHQMNKLFNKLLLPLTKDLL